MFVVFFAFVYICCVCGRTQITCAWFGMWTSGSTLAYEQVWTSLVHVCCLIKVTERKFVVNLICLPLEGLDIIIGMNCLTTNHILIDYGQQKVMFPYDTRLELSLV